MSEIVELHGIDWGSQAQRTLPGKAGLSRGVAGQLLNMTLGMYLLRLSASSTES